MSSDGHGAFGHREHLHLAFDAVRHHGMPGAVAAVCERIQQIAAYRRAPQKYHRTVSQAWVELVAHHATAMPTAGFDDLLHRYPALLDKRLLTRHYRSATLAGERARCEWVAPDLIPFPWTA